MLMLIAALCAMCKMWWENLQEEEPSRAILINNDSSKDYVYGIKELRDTAAYYEFLSGKLKVDQSVIAKIWQGQEVEVYDTTSKPQLYRVELALSARMGEGWAEYVWVDSRFVVMPD